MMAETKIYHLFGIEGGKLLLIFYSTRHCYRFLGVTAKGQLMGNEQFYYTVEAALTEGRKWLGVGDPNET